MLCSCYTSPIRRASRFAELTWGNRQAPLIKLPTLKEAHLGWLQGMSQGRGQHSYLAVSKMNGRMKHAFRAISAAIEAA